MTAESTTESLASAAASRQSLLTCLNSPVLMVCCQRPGLRTGKLAAVAGAVVSTATAAGLAPGAGARGLASSFLPQAASARIAAEPIRIPRAQAITSSANRVLAIGIDGIEQAGERVMLQP
jgi:hypothetical protein